MSFATFQAIAGFAYSALFNASGGHHALMFVIAAGAIVVALLLELAVRLLATERRLHQTDRCMNQTAPCGTELARDEVGTFSIDGA